MEAPGTSTRWEKAQTLFHAALALEEGERARFLEEACAGDPECLAQVVAMLRADGGAGSILDDGLEALAERVFRADGFGDAEGFASAGGLGAPVREVGPYRLVRVIGEGGMGVVWLAQREDTETPVAIKFLGSAGLSPARRERFAREIKMLAKLRHASIARLYDAGALADGTPWFVMEYVEGLPLTEYCEAHALGLGERLRLFRDICEAVQYAHGQAVLHRDLKPSNILVERDGKPRLLDFGVARELQGLDEGAEQTRPGLRFLSREYAAPEWASDGTVGLYTDVYSLGVILYQMLTGRLPVASGGAQAGRPSVLARENAWLGRDALSAAEWRELDVLCLKAMQRDWQERYKSVEALLRDVEHYLRKEPLEAQPDRLVYRVSKFVARNRRAVVGTTLAVVLSVGLVVFFTVRLAEARNAAVAEAARTERIKQFMLHMLGGEDENAAPSKDLRVTTLLDRGVKQADELRADPETQGDLYEDLGNMYNMLAESGKASELLKRAVDRKRAALGGQDPRLMDTLVQLGQVEGDEGETAEGEETIEQALGIARGRRLAESDARVIGAKSALGRVVHQSGDERRAVAILEPLVSGPLVGRESPVVLSQNLFMLSVAEYSLGEQERAESLGQRVLALDKGLFASGHPRMAQDLENLCTIKIARLEYAEAEGLCRRAVAISDAWYGRGHADTALMMGTLARALMLEGKYAEAEPILREVLETQERADGKRDRRVAVTLDSLGRIEGKRGDLAGAERDLARSLDILRSVYGEENFQPAVVSADLGDVYVREGRAKVGEPMLREAVGVLEQTLPAEDPHIAFARALWGHALMSEKRYREAEEELSAAYALMAKQARPPAEQMETVQKELAAVVGAGRKPGSGEQVVESAGK